MDATRVLPEPARLQQAGPRGRADHRGHRAPRRDDRPQLGRSGNAVACRGGLMTQDTPPTPEDILLRRLRDEHKSLAEKLATTEQALLQATFGTNEQVEHL